MNTIMDLPDEMILAIWKYLYNIDVLSAFTGLNSQFDRLIRDDAVIGSLTLLSHYPDQYPHLQPDSILDRFCLELLPKIHHRVRCLTLEPISMGRVLSTGSFPSLNHLTLINVDRDCVQRYFIGNENIDPSFKELFQRQITHLTVALVGAGGTELQLDQTDTIMIPIFSLFANLVELDFSSPGYREFRTRLQSVHPSMMRCFSSALVRLRINVETFDDCLYLLDGRLPHLRRLDIHIAKTISSNLPPSTEILTQLKILSFTSYCKIQEYHLTLIPFFSRMKYLEELNLHLWMRTRTVYIDGTHLDGDILIHMPRLQRFSLHIDTWSFRKSFTEPIPEMIDSTQHLFHNARCYELIRYYDHHLCGRGRCHVYSIPYGLDDFRGITNRFPGGSFPLVRHAELLDMYLPFEHEFFVRISYSFPSLITLRVSNSHPPTKMRRNQLDPSECKSPPVEFKHLTNLDLAESITDYVEYFLTDVNVQMPRLKKLAVIYEYMVTVTENFTREATRRCCSNIESVNLCSSSTYGPEFSMYFPLCK